MIQYEGMKSEASTAGYPMLPAGPYIAAIKAVKIDGTVPNQSLVLRLEIAEGEHKDYFSKRYAHDQQGNSKYAPRYRGDYRLRIPHPNSSSPYPDSDKRRMNDAIYRIEGSNPDFHWDGDENKLVGKAVGISMQEGTYNDAPFTAIGRLEIVDDIRKGLITKMKPRKPAYSADYQAQVQAEQNAAGGFTSVEGDDVDIPF